MWKLRSVAFRTDLFLAATNGEVIRRDRYVVVRTPSNPGFWWGNFLLYPEPPADDDRSVWLEDHARELPYAHARLFAWDRPDGARGVVDPFVEDGFEIDESAILTATTDWIAKPRRWNPRVRVAPLASDADWTAAVHAQTEAFAPRRGGTLDELRTFVERQHVIFRRMHDAGVGQWWGAWLGDELAGSLGLVQVVDDGGGADALGRFQLVGVDPRFGGQGVCATMVYEVAKHAFAERGLRSLVMAADATYHAARVYESVGFRPTESLVALIDKPEKT